MKTVILAGGFGTRISEESYLKPKPMIEIGEMPILWHIMKLYSFYGYNDFVICAGYKQHVVKEWFADYYLNNCDVTFDFSSNNKLTIHNSVSEPWKVTVVDTGLNTMTGGRVKRIQKYIGDEPFLLTYGDGVSNVDISALVNYHRKKDSVLTITSVGAGQKFGVLDLDGNNMVKAFREKNDNDGSMINAGFMVCEPTLFDYLHDDQTVLEREPFETLASQGKLDAYRHQGFWHCMDTKRDKDQLEEMWASGNAPWKVWDR
jgi:glucose-1-phosphate cytidylyltransferase